MRYTIAIPTYNNESTIRAALDSCINQKGHIQYDVIVSDDCSTDNSSSIFDEYENDSKVTIIRNSNNSSLYENHNRCLRAANGEYVLFCHADDILYDDALEKIDLTLSKHQYPARIVCFGRSFFRDFSDSYRKVGRLNDFVSGIAAQELFQNGGLTPSGTCYSRESFLSSGGFLPMRSRITPSDISSMVKFSLDGGEFLMIDRLIFKREFASTACNISEENAYLAKIEAISELSNVVSPDTMATLFENVDKFNEINIKHMIILSKFSNNMRLKRKFKLKYIFNNPLSIRRKLIFKLLFS